MGQKSIKTHNFGGQLEGNDFTYEMDFIFAGYVSGEGFQSSNTTSVMYKTRYETLPSNIASGSVVLARKSDIYSSDDKVAKLIKKKTFGV